MKIQNLTNDILTKSMIITSKRCPKHNERIFHIRNSKGKKVGQFALKDNAEITLLEFKKKYRKKKEGICALFAMKKFLEKLGKKENIDYFQFCAEKPNHHNLEKLYNRFATQIQENPPFFLWPISSKGRNMVKKESELFAGFALFPEIFSF